MRLVKPLRLNHNERQTKWIPRNTPFAVATPGSDAMTAMVSGIQRTDGVLSAALVYQCADSLESMNEEVPDAQA